MESDDIPTFHCLHQGCPLVFDNYTQVHQHAQTHLPPLSQYIPPPELDIGLDPFDALNAEELDDETRDTLPPELGLGSDLFDAFDDNGYDGQPLDGSESLRMPSPQSAPCLAPLPPLDKDSAFIVEPNENRSIGRAGGKNLLQKLNDDPLARHRISNVHFPFADDEEWEWVKWTVDSGLTLAKIDEALRLKYMQHNPLSFQSAREMRGRIEALPQPPRWFQQKIVIPGFTTKDPIVLYYRNSLEVVESLYSNPVFTHSFDISSYRLYTDPDKAPNHRVYGEFMSADYAWEYQKNLPNGHVLAGIILASDKTPLTIGTGNREMHPLLLSIANIHSNVRMKATSRAFRPIAYLPIPKFENVTSPIQSLLSAIVFHICLNIVCGPLKNNKHGTYMSDPRGNIRIVHTPLVVWLSDLLEQILIACVAASANPVTMATTAQFGSATPPGFRTGASTLALLEKATTDALPPTFENLSAGVPLGPWLKACKDRNLSGVYEPVWKDWYGVCPSIFLAHDPLHGLHKMFWDHPVKWAINIMGGPELDARLRALQPRVGVRYWRNGISKLKQVTGREYRELQRVFIAVIAGAVDHDTLCALRALMDFIYQAQNILFFHETFHALTWALSEFHHYKPALIRQKGRQLAHFNIPKLSMLHVIARSATLLGFPAQNTTDISERCHRTLAKEPYKGTNKQDNFHEQCVRYLDRVEKCHLFDLYTRLLTLDADLTNDITAEENAIAADYPQHAWYLNAAADGEEMELKGPRITTNLFDNRKSTVTRDNTTAVLLNCQPHFPALTVAQASEKFGLPRLLSALLECCDDPTSPLPFNSMNVWTNFRIQHKSWQDNRVVSPPRRVQALPPSSTLPFGRCNTLLVSGSSGQHAFDVNGGTSHQQMRSTLTSSP